MNSDLRPHPTRPDLALRRANVLAQLDLERIRNAHRQNLSEPILSAELDSRLERIEATLVDVLRRLEDVESLAGLAQAQAESCSGAW